MADNSQKTPLAYSIPRIIRGQVESGQQDQPQGYPSSVKSVNADGTVTASFQMQGAGQSNTPTLKDITIPQYHSEYAIPPTQVGDKGFLVMGQTYLGGQSGLGGGISNYYRTGNFTTATWHPIQNKNWTRPDPNAYLLQGPNGVILRDMASGCVITLTATQITIKDSFGHEVWMVSGGLFVDPGADLLYLGCPPSGAGSCDFVETVSGPSTKVKAFV